MLEIVWQMPQGSIFGPWPFLLYINDLSQALKLLEPLMFADDTNLFYLGKEIHSLFNLVNDELLNISHWFDSNKLSINADETKFTLFNKVRQRDSIPPALPTLKINNALLK